MLDEGHQSVIREIIYWESSVPHSAPLYAGCKLYKTVFFTSFNVTINVIGSNGEGSKPRAT